MSDNLLALGYPLVQQYGQRRFGPPSDWVGPLPPKGSELFICKLPGDVFEDELVPILAQVGLIYELRLIMADSGLNRGYAFVRYSTEIDANKAIDELHGFEIRPGRHIVVVKSTDNRKLYLGKIPSTKTDKQILKVLSTRFHNIVDVILPKHSLDRRLNRGFAFVEFTSHRAAAVARRALVTGRVRLWGRNVKVEWAVPQRNDSMMTQRQYANLPNQDEGCGSACSACAAESSCGSPTNVIDSRFLQNPYSPPTYNYYTPAPVNLNAMYMWTPSVYYQQYVDGSGAEVWVCHVGAPFLLLSPHHLGVLQADQIQIEDQIAPI